MMEKILVVAVLFLVGMVAIPKDAEANPKVLLKTSKGDITIELNADKAPITVKNFMKYVRSGHYDGTIFHRVIDGFMVQGGGLLENMSKKGGTDAPIKNEATNGLKNDKGTLAMARTGVVDSATDQFFINVSDNAFLNHKNTSSSGFGYAVFGKVTAGMDVVDKIRQVKTANNAGHGDVPVSPVSIVSATEIK